MTDKRVNRRNFLAVAVGGAGATALSGLATASPAAASGIELAWDRSADIVVVGYGGAGAAAAITAYDAGASVLVIEKTENGGGSTRYSGGFFVSPRSVDGAVDYLMHCARAADGHHYDLDRESLTAWAQEAQHNADWIGELGGDPYATLRGWYDVPGAADYVTWQPRPNSTGVGLWNVLHNAVSERGIEVVYNVAGTELVTRIVDEENGSTSIEIVGVIVGEGEQRMAVQAAKGVILTTGGFDYDEQLKQNYLRTYPAYSTGHPGDTGDAIKLASKAGAALSRLTGTAANVCHKFDDVPVAYPSSLQLNAANRTMIMVDQRGRRFINESLNYDAVAKSLEYFDAADGSYPRNPCWMVFDDAARTAGPAGLPNPIGDPVYGWSADNSEEISKGWVLEATSLAELADKMGVDAASLEQSVERYNGDAEAGNDAEFGRTLGLKALEGPAYYALKAYPGLWATGGGPRLDSSARVLDPAGTPIARLYAAGSASSFCFSFLYPLSGTAIGDCFAMGRIAGQHASTLTEWANEVE
ncbi:FAD-dependent oxidoreductase [Pelagibacterium montanilacus]|uniref:FAD-dependent oxidoreductase n=1 Tax=Pelagibacterium montanilacus TaxID=2185280 RepID=UPI0013DEBA5E|nr:FAD-binding protein [Pelagibacterium montanilacus]